MHPQHTSRHNLPQADQSSFRGESLAHYVAGDELVGQLPQRAGRVGAGGGWQWAVEQGELRGGGGGGGCTGTLRSVVAPQEHEQVPETLPPMAANRANGAKLVRKWEERATDETATKGKAHGVVASRRRLQAYLRVQGAYSGGPIFKDVGVDGLREVDGSAASNGIDRQQCAGGWGRAEHHISGAFQQGLTRKAGGRALPPGRAHAHKGGAKQATTHACNGKWPPAPDLKKSARPDPRFSYQLSVLSPEPPPRISYAACTCSNF